MFDTNVENKNKDCIECNPIKNPYEWIDITTEDLFVNKRIVLFSLPRHLYQYAQQITFLNMKKIMKKLDHIILMMFIVYQ